jgi:thioredoxin 1
MSEVKITDSNFEEFINGDKPLVVDFWAEWCGPCKMISPYIEELSKEYEGKVVIGKMNVDENEEVATQYGIRNIPTVLFFKEGKLVNKSVGAVSKNALEDNVKSLL